MAASWTVTVHDDDEDFSVRVDVANDGAVVVSCLDSSGAVAYIPRLTPFEAGMLAKSLEKASEFADTM